MIYERFCLPCHGSAGDGRGPAAPYVWPAPRAFTRGDLKWRSTPFGQPPAPADLRATIALGAPGTSMPGFADSLSAQQIDDVIEVVRSFAPPARAGVAQPITLGAPPPPDAARGAALWRDKGCAVCHGASALASYDLSTGLRRPRAPGPDADRRAAAFSIATGLSGTAMPGFAGALPEADIWALADHVVAIVRDGERARRRAARSSHAMAMPAALIDADRGAPIRAGTWPGSDPDEAAVFGAPVPPQGAPPASLAPAQASLAARQCARCHAKQYREWETSFHRAAVSPGLSAQTFDMAAGERAACLRCHAPLDEQSGDPVLRSDAVSCAGCHVRGWVRHGPPDRAPSLLPLPGYPLAALPLYERADFCMPCHQLPPRNAVAGRPLLDTYREWLAGPYMRRGVQCQHCHMPNREHRVLGIHDPQTFREAIRLDARAHRRAGEVTAVATLTNAGAGHYLPTTPTPAAWLSITLLDARGAVIAGATARRRIGRELVFERVARAGVIDGEWHERGDTRIAPGESLTLARGWAGGRTAEAIWARITVEVHPDDYYERLYADKLAGKLAAEQRALYQQALTRALAARYVAEQRDVKIAGAP